MKQLLLILLSFLFIGSADAGQLRILSPFISTAAACIYSDSFPSSINSTYWTESDTDGDLAVASGELRFNSSGTAQTFSYIISKWTFNANADFDIRIDFNDLSWTQGDSASNVVGLEINYDSGNEWASVTRRITSVGTNQYCYGGIDTANTCISNSDASGRLRITYISNVIKAYYWNGQWEWDGNTAGVTLSEDFTGNALYVQLTFVRRAASGSNSMVVDLDNLRIINGCENITLP